MVVDTAGRLGIDAELMQQAADIRDAVRPDEVLFVVDAMIGQDAVTTAQAFLEGVDFTGVVLTKLDGDARGGAALSVAQVCERPIMFASTGEKLADFDVFHPERMASRILGMGDVLTLIEQAEQAFDASQAEEMAAKIAGDDFTLEDFLDQMLQMRKMGPIANLLGMLPGMGQMKEQLAQVDDRDVDRVMGIIRSMTPIERQQPKILNASRKARIARGSGRHRHRGQQAARPLRRSPQDDEADGGHGRPRRRRARRGGRSRRARVRRARATRRRARPRRAASCPAARPRSRRLQPLRPPGGRPDAGPVQAAAARWRLAGSGLRRRAPRPPCARVRALAVRAGGLDA